MNFRWWVWLRASGVKGGRSPSSLQNAGREGGEAPATGLPQKSLIQMGLIQNGLLQKGLLQKGSIF